jgi:hypothetical protein
MSEVAKDRTAASAELIVRLPHLKLWAFDYGVDARSHWYEARASGVVFRLELFRTERHIGRALETYWRRREVSFRVESLSATQIPGVQNHLARLRERAAIGDCLLDPKEAKNCCVSLSLSQERIRDLLWLTCLDSRSEASELSREASRTFVSAEGQPSLRAALRLGELHPLVSNVPAETQVLSFPVSSVSLGASWFDFEDQWIA